MVTTQMQIDALLTKLEVLLEQIEPLRQRVAELVQVQSDYGQKMGALDDEMKRLVKLRESLLARLSSRGEPQPVVDPTPPVTSPEAVISLINPRDLPPPSLESPRTARKRALARHIRYFIDSSQTSVMQVINAVLVDEQRDMVDMLEVLAWGDIWTVRADWETLDDQYDRLSEWHTALQERLSYWQRELQSLETDGWGRLWQKKKESSEAEWLAFLTTLAQEAEADKGRLTHEITVLEQAYRKKQLEEGKRDA